MKYCEKFNGVILSDKSMFFRARCKSWTCSYCTRENKTAWRKAIRKQLIDTPEYALCNWVMLTFTMPPYIHASESKVLDSAKVIQSKWNVFMTGFKKHYHDIDKKAKVPKRKFTYVRVLENHKSGVLHIHLLINLDLAQEDIYINPNDDTDVRLLWLKTDDKIMSYGFGWKHHVLFLDTTAYAINYVTKYLTKDADDNFSDILKETKIRRVQTSRDIKAPHSESEDTWKVKYRITELDFEQSEIILDLNTKRKITKENLDEYGVYPPMKDEES